MVEMQQTTLKVIVIVHFILTVWASMFTQYLPTAYIYMNAFVFAFAVWAIICPESIDAIFLYFILTVISIVMDIIFIGVFATIAGSVFDNANGIVSTTMVNTYRFSLGMSILNLILKPLSSYMLYRLYQDRAGLTHFPQVLNYARPHGYDTIDQPIPPSAVETAMPYTQVEKRPVS